MSKRTKFEVRITINFLIFCVIAAPIQFYMDAYSLYTDPSQAATTTAALPRWVTVPLKDAILFFYAIVLSIEALFRLSHIDSLKESLRIYVLRLLLWIPLLAFVFEYLVSEHYRSTNTLPGYAIDIQIGAAILALFLSTIVHFVVMTYESSRLQ